MGNDLTDLSNEEFDELKKELKESDDKTKKWKEKEEPVATLYEN